MSTARTCACPTPLTHIPFSGPDVAATRARVTARGGEVLADTDVGGAAILVRDPDGQLLELMPGPAV